MQVELAQLLRDRAVAHPSRAVAALLDGSDFRLSVVGWPWWSDQADGNNDRKIEFLFRGVGDGVLNLPAFDAEDDEVLEVFSVSESSDAPWIGSGGSDIYCNAVLSRPWAVYLAVHDYLVTHGAFRRASEFLNFPEGELLAPFFAMVESESYLLGRFPAALRDLVCAELEKQGVSYSELPWAESRQSGRLLVTIGPSQFFCESATASFDT